VVYTASSLPLCALEILANHRELPDDYVAIAVTIPDEVAIITVIATLTVADLPEKWWNSPHRVETRDIGTAWVTGRLSAGSAARNLFYGTQDSKFRSHSELVSCPNPIRPIDRKELR
jgi:hypothetical protein